jgi:hypothetical protein
MASRVEWLGMIRADRAGSFRETIMNSNIRTFALAASFVLVLVPPGYAQDAMSADAMAPGAMTPISDDDYNLCVEQADALTFPAAKRAANAACNGLHMGMDVMGAMDAMEAEQGAMAPDAMATDAMATDTMAPAQ